ncbi:Colicin I receptor [Andreprevotia sp. IGB-42]|uniref:TonB-dependent receptor plug domain-containing protein n=1 Tax=Andreprevotia sp. IGB-42 TaxID=2497473 RepID=UPI00135711CE|nr:TonB-dependent receptor [Andreprevotia sp. IGB-42]KAF0812652.1 Colicin I receptor [Andreprevotia sp. IGB-42]
MAAEQFPGALSKRSRFWAGLALFSSLPLAWAETAPSGQVQDVVVTTGTRGEQRTVADSPVPIDVVTSEQIQATGKTGLKEILNQLLPSFNLPGINGGGTSWTVRATTLRGLSGDQVLYLVNGKRRHNTALINNLARVGNGGVPVDLDLIPVAAIDHIEVLRDGAAALYGSDAIAGVINIVLKKTDSGGESTTTIGQNYEGDGASGHQTLDWGIRLGEEGFAHFSLDAKANEAAPRGDPSSLAHVYNPLPNGQPDPRDKTVNRRTWGLSYGQGRDAVVSGAYNAELPVNDIVLYSFSTLAYRNSRKNTGSFLPNNLNALPELYPDGFNAYRRIYETDFQVAGGARGTVSNWKWDLSSTYGQDHAKLDGENTLNATLGPASPTSFNLATQIYDQWTNNLDFTRGFDAGLAKPLDVSIGFEQRWEQYRILPGDPSSYAIGNYVIPGGFFKGLHPQPGLASYNGTSPADSGEITRNNVAAYLDVGADITKQWYLGAAGRFEHYSDSAGNTASGKLTTRYEFTPGFAVRGTASNGFRAPSLAQTLYSSSTFTGQISPTGVWQTFPIKVLRVTSPEAKALGAEPLKPEKSLNYSVGFTLEPTRSARLTVDAYQIDISDRITQTSLLNGPVVSAILAANGLTPGLSAQYYTNAVDTRTRGVDVVGEYTSNLDDYGAVKWSAGYSWNKSRITHIKDTPQQLRKIGYDLFNRQQQGDLTVGTPQDKLVLSGDWLIKQWNVNLRLTRYGDYVETGVYAANDRTYSAKWITDLDVSYAFTPNVNLAIGANNLFDVYPDKIGVIDAKTGNGGYGSFSPFGINGGFYYTRLTYRFD